MELVGVTISEEYAQKSLLLQALAMRQMPIDEAGAVFIEGCIENILGEPLYSVFQGLIVGPHIKAETIRAKGKLRR